MLGLITRGNEKYFKYRCRHSVALSLPTNHSTSPGVRTPEAPFKRVDVIVLSRQENLPDSEQRPNRMMSEPSNINIHSPQRDALAKGVEGLSTDMIALSHERLDSMCPSEGDMKTGDDPYRWIRLFSAMTGLPFDWCIK
jgi:hypothetical protein